MADSNKPEFVVRDGALKATIWENRGEKRDYHTVTFAKTYEDPDGNLKDTNTFYQSELLRIAELGRETYGMINDLKRELAQSRGQNGEDREAFRRQRRGGPEAQPDHDRDYKNGR